MAPAGPDDHRQPVGDLGVRVDITVIPGPRGPTLWERIAPMRTRWAIGGVAAAAVATGALVASLSMSGRSVTGPSGTQRLPTTVLPNTVLYPTYLRATGRAAVDAAADPLRCLRLLIALHDPSLRNGAFARNLPCGHPRGPYTLIAVPAPQSGRTRR